MESISSYSFKQTNQLEDLREVSTKAYEDEVNKLLFFLIVEFICIFVILIVGMVGMIVIEGWNSSVAFYWAAVTICTVGYGDVVPTSNEGKIFTIFYAVIGE